MKKIFIIMCGFAYLQTINAQDINQMINAKPFVASGSLMVRSVLMTGSNALKGGNANSIMLSGSPNISIYGFDIPLSFSISPQSKSFQQPFNQFGINPHYKWVTLHLGYTNLSYNPFTLAGHTMFGYGFDIAPKKFRFGVMKGRLSAATKVDTISQSLQPVSFTRKGIAGHIGFEGAKNKINLSVIVAEDDSNSIRYNLSNISLRNGREITPAGNVALGLTTKLQITKQLFFEANYGLSIYTRDIRNPSLLNNIVPDGDARIVAKKLLQVNQSTEYYNAILASFGYKIKSVMLKLRYLRVAPEFKTMGAYFMNSDIQNFTIMPSFSLWKKKLSISSSIGFQNDNLNKNKRTTSNRIIGSVVANAQVSKKMIIAANYSNYNINQVANVTRIADTFRITQTNQNINITPVYTWVKTKKSNSVLANINFNNLNDFNNSYANTAQSRTLNTLSALVSFRQNFIQSKFGYTVGVNYNNVWSSAINDNNIGGNIGVDKTFYKDKFTVGFTGTVLTGKRNASSTLIINSGLQANAKLSKMHAFNLGTFINNTQLKSAGITNNINYFRGELAYTLNF